MKLRTYQRNFIDAIADCLSRVRKCAAALSTGGGKTVVFAGICFRYLTKANRPGILPGSGKTILILVHRKELLRQTRKTCYNAFKVICEPVIAGKKFIPEADVYVAMVETGFRMLKRSNLAANKRLHPEYPKLKKDVDEITKHNNLFGDVGMVIIDEAHRLEFMKLHPYFPQSMIIGFTATPQTRSKKQPMKKYYDDIVCGAPVEYLIDWNKHHPDEGLCQNITYAPRNSVDRAALSSIEGAVIAGEFNDKVMSTEYSKAQYVKATVAAYEDPKHGIKGTKTIVFNVNIEHSKKVNDAFIAAGYPSRHLDSNASDDERDDTLKWFKQTPGAILNNVGIATTGFDEPTIETVIVNKMTMSMPNWLQMDGRGSRPIGPKFIDEFQIEYPYDLLPKSMFTIIDMGGNAMEHGDWNQPRDWYDLFHNPGKPGKNNVAPIKCCPNCEAIIAAAARSCVLCGYKYPEKEIAVEADLHDFIVVTKNINVEQVIQDNRNAKKYYPFFKIGTELALKAKETIPKMTDGYASFILEEYHKLTKEMLAKLRVMFPLAKHNNHNNWYKKTALTFLVGKLREQFPDWKTTMDKDNEQPPPPVDPQLKIPGINNIQSLTQMKYHHYEE